MILQCKALYLIVQKSGIIISVASLFMILVENEVISDFEASHVIELISTDLTKIKNSKVP